jgi:hypothetical protein
VIMCRERRRLDLRMRYINNQAIMRLQRNGAHNVLRRTRTTTAATHNSTTIPKMNLEIHYKNLWANLPPKHKNQIVKIVMSEICKHGLLPTGFLNDKELYQTWKAGRKCVEQIELDELPLELDELPLESSSPDLPRKHINTLYQTWKAVRKFGDKIDELPLASPELKYINSDYISYATPCDSPDHKTEL